MLAALGPKVLRLGRRTHGRCPPLSDHPGAHPAFTPACRPGPLLAPEQKVVLTGDPEHARELGRSVVVFPYLSRVNYLQNLRGLGSTDEDLAGDGSDALIDALVGHGDPAAAVAPIAAHFDAGADHVAAQLITEPDTDPRPGYAAIADAVLTTRVPEEAPRP